MSPANWPRLSGQQTRAQARGVHSGRGERDEGRDVNVHGKGEGWAEMQVAELVDGLDSNQPRQRHDPPAEFTRDQWDEFAEALRRGDFDGSP